MNTMISGSMSQMPPMGQMPSTMTDQQREQLGSLLESYGGDIAESDYEELAQSLIDMGIKPSQEMREMLESVGVDVDKLRDVTRSIMGDKPMGPPPPEGELEDVSASSEDASATFDQLLEMLQQSETEDRDLYRSLLEAAWSDSEGLSPQRINQISESGIEVNSFVETARELTIQMVGRSLDEYV